MKELVKERVSEGKSSSKKELVRIYIVKERVRKERVSQRKSKERVR